MFDSSITIQNGYHIPKNLRRINFSLDLGFIFSSLKRKQNLFMRMPKIFLPGVQPFSYTDFVSYLAPELSFPVLKISGRNHYPSTHVCHIIGWWRRGSIILLRRSLSKLFWDHFRIKRVGLWQSPGPQVLLHWLLPSVFVDTVIVVWGILWKLGCPLGTLSLQFLQCKLSRRKDLL